MRQTSAALRAISLSAFACVALAGTAAAAPDRPLVSEDAVWQQLPAIPESHRAMTPWIRPNQATIVRLDHDAFAAAAANAPLDGTEKAFLEPGFIDLPMPGGSFRTFTLVEAPVMHPDLQAKYPQIRTYRGFDPQDASATLRLSITPDGFAAQIRSPMGDVYIDKVSREDTSTYAVYTRADLTNVHEFACHTDGTVDERPKPFGRMGELGQIDINPDPLDTNLNLVVGETLRTYQTAIIANGEYTQFHGGTVASGLAAVVTAVNRVTGIYEDEVAIRLQLVADNDELIYTNPNTDGLSNNTNLINQVTGRINQVIGSSNYDLGHGFSTGAGGLAGLGVVCSGSKGNGITGLPQPINDPFVVDYVAHEIGHQFGATHTFNGISGSCSGGNRTGSTAYEPGSGSSIMAYAGICGSDNTVQNSDPYFHLVSLGQIRAEALSNGGCPDQTATGNTDPTVDAGPNRTIPRQTPYELTIASSFDAQGDALTFDWQQLDLGPAQALAAGDNGQSPLVRTRPPTSGSRMIPALNVILAGGTSNAEKLPNTNRTMRWGVIVRDNNPAGGGYTFDDRVITSTTSAGPFRVTGLDSPQTLNTATVNITWDVANTNNAPVNTDTVTIRLSEDGGQTFPHVLASETPNDGSQTVDLPLVDTTQGRIKIEADGNIYFDINNANLAVTPPLFPATFAFVGSAPTDLSDSAPTTVTMDVDPGSFTLDANSVVVSLFPAGLPLQSVTATPGAGTLYTADIPAFPCDTSVSYFVSVSPIDGGGITSDFVFANVTDCSTDCPADVNDDGAATPADFTAWLGCFNNPASAPFCDRADVNGSGSVDPADFTAWLAAFNAGCD